MMIRSSGPSRKASRLAFPLVAITAWGATVPLTGWGQAQVISVAATEGFKMPLNIAYPKNAQEAADVFCAVLQLPSPATILQTEYLLGLPRITIGCGGLRQDSWYSDWASLCEEGFQGSGLLVPSRPYPKTCERLTPAGARPSKNSPLARGGVCGVGNPINPGIGNKLQIESDYQGTGQFPLIFHRIYSSSMPFALNEGIARLSIGSKWRHNFQRSINFNSNDTVSTAVLHRDDGQVLYFNLADNGEFWSDSDITGQLKQLRDANGQVSWIYRNADDEIEQYGPTGRLISITNRSGLQHKVTTNSLGQLLRIEDDWGRGLVFDYEASMHLTSFADPAGNRYTYTYDNIGNHTLLSVAYPVSPLSANGYKRQYVYGEWDRTEGGYRTYALTGLVDENGTRYATWTYDSQGRAISSEHANGADKVTLTYNTGNTVVTDARGTTRTKNLTTILGMVKSTGESQPGGSGCGPASASLTYDANGNVASRTDFNGSQTLYTYDLTRNLETKRVEASGKPEARTVSTQWHPYWRLPVKVAEPNKVTTYLYNGDTDNGQLVSCAPASATVPSLNGGTQPIGVLCKKTEQATTDANGSQGFSAPASGTARTSSWTYNLYGQVLTADGLRTDVADLTTYTYYDAADPDLSKRGRLASVTNALGHVTRIDAYDAHGNPLTLIDPNGVTTTLAYDARQRLTSRSVGNEFTRYQYDGVGQLTRLTLPDGSRLDYTYDPAHRLTAIGDTQGNQILYTLDAMGNRVKEDIKDPQGVLARTLTRAYDALNRLQTLTGAGNE